MPTTEQFQIIYADAPWSYRDKCRAGERGAGYKYPTLTPKTLATLRVPEIAAPDSVLLMWTTPPQLPVALQLAAAWGFEYVTRAFVWVKTTPLGKEWHWGMGHHTRANPEDVYLFRRGNGLKRVDASVHSVIKAPVGRHSAKPPEARERIDQLYGPVPSRIELFARERANGWDAWGLDLSEAEESIPLAALWP